MASALSRTGNLSSLPITEIAAFGKPRDAGERDRTEIIGVGGEPEPDAVEYQEFCAFTHGSRVCENVPA